MARALVAMNLGDAIPTLVHGNGPELRHVDPRKLLVNDQYQREISRAGQKLIIKIVTNFSWARYKLPTVVETDEGLIVIDGQHTATACACIPTLREIPIAVVAVASTEEQALAFLGINKDRLNVNHMQLHHAAAASGDGNARLINEVCEEAGVTVLRSQRGPKMYGEGETVAVKNVSDMVRDNGRDHTIKVLTLCRRAKLAPISQAYIRAVSAILLDEEKMSVIDEEALLATVQKTRGTIDKDAKTWAAEHDTSFFKALSSVLFKAAKNHTPLSANRARLNLPPE